MKRPPVGKACREAGLFILAVMLLSAAACAEQDDDTNDGSLASGMTLMKVGNANVVMPKDGAVTKQGDVLVVEGPTEYSARKFVAMEKRMANIESKVSELQKDIEEIKKNMADARDKRSVLSSGRQ